MYPQETSATSWFVPSLHKRRSRNSRPRPLFKIRFPQLADQTPNEHPFSCSGAPKLWSRHFLPPDLSRDNYPYPPPPLRNGSGWDGVTVITGPWIFVPTHFISMRLPTGKSMSSALMKHLHLCPMELLVFIFCSNNVPVRSPDTTTHTGRDTEWWGRGKSRHGSTFSKVRFVVFCLCPVDNNNWFCLQGIWRYNTIRLVEANNTRFA